MTKVTLSPLGNLSNQSAAVQTINNNNSAITDGIENTISRDGTQPNMMNAEFDMNGHKIINLPDALSDQEPATYGQLNEGLKAIGEGAVVNAKYLTLENNSLLFNERVLTPGAGLTITDNGANSTAVVNISDPELNALKNVTGTGVLTRTGTGAITTRAVTGTSNEITVNNGDGVAGNPTLSLPANLTLSGKTLSGGKYLNSVFGYTSPGAGAWYDTSTTPNRFFVGTDFGPDGFRIYSSGPNNNALYIDGPTGIVTVSNGFGANAITASTFNGNAITAGTGSLTLGAQTLNVNNSMVLTTGVSNPTITFQGTDTYVGRNTTDTLSNKTLNAPVINSPTGITKTDVGLSNVDNTSDANKPVSTAQATSIATKITGPASATNNNFVMFSGTTGKVGFDGGKAAPVGSVVGTTDTQTLTNKTLTSPNITTPTGIVKGDVGLSNVDNTSDTTKWAATKTLTNTTYDTAGAGNSLLINGVAATANTGTGAVVRDTNATLIAPTLGVATATAINKVTITPPAASAALTIANLKTLSANNTLTLAGTDGATVTFQGTDTYVGRASTDTLTNKTFDTAGVGNGLYINGLAAQFNTGIGAVVRSNGAALVAPNLGTPASGVMTNVTGLPLTALPTQSAYTLLGNNTSGTTTPASIDIAALTPKASPVSGDIVLIQDSAASNAFKRTTVGALASAGSVASYEGRTGAVTAQGSDRANLMAAGYSFGLPMSNGQLATSASAGALTVAVKTLTGADPSSGDPVLFYFRDTTLTSGTLITVPVTAALSVVLPAGATLGATSGQGLRVWIQAFNNAGTVQLAAINCTNASGVVCPQEHKTYPTSTPGNSAKAIYSTSAISTPAPWRFIGFVEWNSLTTAGTWTAPDYVQLFGPGVKRPGDVVQVVYGSSGTTFTTTSSSPQTTNLSASITPTSPANAIHAAASGTSRVNAAGILVFSGLYRATTRLNENEGFGSGSGVFKFPSSLSALDFPNTGSSVIYSAKVRNNDGATTVTWGDDNTTTTMLLKEIMA